MTGVASCRMSTHRRRRTDPGAGVEAARRARDALRRGEDPARDDLRTGVRFLLEELAARAPGDSVEVRVPPYGVVQCVAGPRHTRGTPANVVETDPVSWVRLAWGDLSWQQAIAEYLVGAGGERSDLAPHLPLGIPEHSG